MTDRATVALGSPEASDSDFSAVDSWEPDAELFRVCSAAFDASPWYFSSDGSGRFDLRPPDGTCYWATHVQSALAEKFGLDFDEFGIEWFAKQRWWTSEVDDPASFDCIDLLAANAGRIGITSEIFTHTDQGGGYTLTNEWARAIRESGRTAIRTGLRFSSPTQGQNVAVFGPEGPQASADGFNHKGPFEFDKITIDNFAASHGLACSPSLAHSSTFKILS